MIHCWFDLNISKRFMDKQIKFYVKNYLLSTTIPLHFHALIYLFIHSLLSSIRLILSSNSSLHDMNSFLNIRALSFRPSLSPSSI